MFEHFCFISKRDKYFSFEVWVSLMNIHTESSITYMPSTSRQCCVTQKQTELHAMSDSRRCTRGKHWCVNNVLIYLMISSTMLDRNIVYRETVTNRIDAYRWGNLYSQNVDDVVNTRCEFHRDDFLNECVGLSGVVLRYSALTYITTICHYTVTRRTRGVCFSFVIPAISQALVHPPDSYFELYGVTRRNLDLRDWNKRSKYFRHKSIFLFNNKNNLTRFLGLRQQIHK